MRTVVDSSVSSTVTATITAISGNTARRRFLQTDDYTLSIVVARATPAGSYPLKLETYMSRDNEDTTIYTDTLTLVVTEPAATTTTETATPTITV